MTRFKGAVAVEKSAVGTVMDGASLIRLGSKETETAISCCGCGVRGKSFADAGNFQNLRITGETDFRYI